MNLSTVATQEARSYEESQAGAGAMKKSAGAEAQKTKRSRAEVSADGLALMTSSVTSSYSADDLSEQSQESAGVLTAAGCGIGSVHAVVRSNLLVEPSEVEEGEISVSGALFIVNVQEQRAIAAPEYVSAARKSFKSFNKARLLIFSW
ncbi:hypothetical protein F511_45039 [Dorcoceras hygrometricum]|uniref:Uncharacterized protein n=1 Tax=Dorcoceras hygrometricum TaxID=472368 RepID=A0A2Z7C9N6_9LAMI|nr:hypothetical protein F511_45039 [Dorcoceras hygrometricum]